MSDYESHSGKIKKIYQGPDETYDQLLIRIWNFNGIDPDKIWEYGPTTGDIRSCFFNQFSGKYFEVAGEIWEFLEDKRYEGSEDYCHLVQNPDGTISFETRFYNGGTYTDEMISDEMLRMKRQGKL